MPARKKVLEFIGDKAEMVRFDGREIDMFFRKVRLFNNAQMGYLMYKISRVPGLVGDLEEVTAFLREKGVCSVRASLRRRSRRGSRRR